MADEAKKKCKYCKFEIGATDERCPRCKCAQTVQACKHCGKPMPLGAKYCNECKSYQDVRQLFAFSVTVLSLLTALIAVLTPFVHTISDFLNRHSNTTMIVKDVDENGIYVQFRNSGHSMSQIAKAQLIFDDSVKLKPAELQQKEIGNNLIRPDEPLAVVLRLSAGLERTKDVSDEAILDLIRQKKVKLRCIIAESNDPHHVLPDVELPDAGTNDLITKGLHHA